MKRPALTSIPLLLVLVLGSPVAAQTVRMSAIAPLSSDCGDLPNTWPQLPETYFYFPGSTVQWQVTIDLQNANPISAGTYEFWVEGDYLHLQCDPATYVLPGAAVVSFCVDGGGPPADGFFRVENIDVPAMTPVVIQLQTTVPPDTPFWTTMPEDSEFYSPQTGFVRSDLASILVREPIPRPLTTLLTATDLNGPPVRPGDEIEYEMEVTWSGCFDRRMVNVVAPLPPELSFVAFDRCGGGFDCTYDPALRRVHADAHSATTFVDHWRVVYRARVGAGTPAARSICHQSRGNGFELSDDPTDAIPDSPTCVVVDGSGPSLTLTKTMIDDDGGGYLTRGEAVTYEITIANTGDVAVTDAHLVDVLSAGLAGFDPATVSVVPPSGSNASAPPPGGNGGGVLDLRDLVVPARSTVSVRFAAAAAAAASGLICNQAEITSAGLAGVTVSDDPGTVTVGDATCYAVMVPGPEPVDCAVVGLEVGQRHSIALKLDGSLSVWGENDHGQLGDGTRNDALRPAPVGLPEPVVAVAGGSTHTVAVTADGRAWAWGDNTWGQLGNGTFTDFTIPVEVAGLTDVVAVAAGFFHSLAAKADGTVWAWGYNSEGQLGDGSRSSSAMPSRVIGPTGGTAVAAGAWSSIALGTGGSLWAWGDNEYGQLADGTRNDSTTAVALAAPTGVTQIAHKSFFALARDDQGRGWSWGSGEAGALGTGSFSSIETPFQLPLAGVEKVDTGNNHSIAIASGGRVWNWGNGAEGQLANGDAACICEPPSPLSFPPPDVCPSVPTPILVPALFGARDVAAGWTHSLALLADESIHSWGGNFEGQLGLTTTSCEKLPVEAAGPCSAWVVEDPLRVASGADSCVDVEGNEDGALEPGERVEIDLGIRNAGGTQVEGFPDITAKLQLPAPVGVTYVEDTVTYAPSPLPPSASATPSGPFVLDLAADIECPAEIDLIVNVFTRDGTFPIDVTLTIGPCDEQCLPEECDLSLERVRRLLLVKEGGQPRLSWDEEPNALEGYRAYTLPDKSEIPRANDPLAPRLLECVTALSSSTDCLGLTPIADAVSPLFYQLLSVCGNGLEGPVD